MINLGHDVERAWNSPGVSMTTRKQIVRTLIEEIIVRLEKDAVALVVRWRGGDHTPLRVMRNRTGEHRWTVDADVAEMVTSLARLMPDKTIAALLNRTGKTTGKGNSWTSSRVNSMRQHRQIPVYREGERQERGELTLDEAAERLGVSPSTVQRLIAEKFLAATHLCKGAPWVIRASDLDADAIRQIAAARKSRRPASGDPQQEVLSF